MGLRLLNSQGTGLIPAEILIKFKHQFYELLILLPYNESVNKEDLWAICHPQKLGYYS